MKSSYASKKLKNQIWPDYIAHFKSETTKGSYLADIEELMAYCRKDFQEITAKEVKAFYEELKERTKAGRISPATMAKKFKEYHSFAAYLCEHREKYQIPKSYSDVYAGYLPYLAKQERYARSVPIADIDRLLAAAREDEASYTIITLLYRAGLTSREITEMKVKNILLYDNGMYLAVPGRKVPSYVPEDAAKVLLHYLEVCQPQGYLFRNRRGDVLNLMYISRMLKKYEMQAGIPCYSAQSIRNTCGVTLFAYGANEEETAGQMGVTVKQIHRYKNLTYRENLLKSANKLVRISVIPPE